VFRKKKTHLGQQVSRQVQLHQVGQPLEGLGVHLEKSRRRRPQSLEVHQAEPERVRLVGHSSAREKEGVASKKSYALALEKGQNNNKQGHRVNHEEIPLSR